MICVVKLLYGPRALVIVPVTSTVYTPPAIVLVHEITLLKVLNLI